MKITIWIRPANEGRDMTLRLDTKLESLDTRGDSAVRLQARGRDCRNNRQGK